MKTTFKYDHYYKYAELESNLKELENDVLGFPEVLIPLSSSYT